jgi:hypothetical protein
MLICRLPWLELTMTGLGLNFFDRVVSNYQSAVDHLLALMLFISNSPILI